MRTARMIALVILAVAVAACGSGSGSGRPRRGGGPPAAPYGLTERVVVADLAFPASAPRPGSLKAVEAFPGLGARFDRPLFLTHAGDGTDRLFVVEQSGVIHVFPNDPAVTATTVFLDIRDRVNSGGNEEGLLGLAFAPDHASSGRFYVYYCVAGPRRTRLSRFSVTADPDRADAASEEVLLDIAEPYVNHNGGMIAFGPDGMLYVGVGDGGGAGDPGNRAQDLTKLLGKILRLTPAGGVPADNPFVGQGGGVRGEVFAYGLRNPWRFSFDRATGALWAGDVGQNREEEVDRIERGGNYGWRFFEGTREYDNPDGRPRSDFLAPIVSYDRSLGYSVTGGYVYRGPGLPDYDGVYLYGDFGTGRVWALVADGSTVVANEEVASVSGLSSFGEDAAGDVYACSFDGRIYRFEAAGGGDPDEGIPKLLSETGLFADTATLRAAPGLVEYDVNAPLWSDGARKRRWIALPGNERIGFSATGPWELPRGTVLVKHFEIETAPDVVRRLETRALVLHDEGWRGYTYRWNEAQTDAVLLADGLEEEIAPGRAWSYPGRTDCLRCHTAAAGRVLGVRTAQMNRDFDYDGVTDNQLRAWDHVRLLRPGAGPPADLPALPDPAGDAPVADRARAWLDTNCAHCHRPGGPTPVELDLRYATPAKEMNAIGVPSTHTPGVPPGAPRIVAGDHAASVLWQVIGRASGDGRMPPLGQTIVDAAALDLIGAWIDAGAD